MIYVISKKYVEESYAFLASCFFMFQSIFLMTEAHGRANIAMFFFALAMLTLFNDKIDPLKKRFLFIVFMASCMVSHYSTTYIFFFVMAGTFIGTEALSKKYTFKKFISLTLVILFFAMIFFWYSQVTEAAFDAGVGFIETTLKELNNFFIVESRGAGAQSLLGGGIMEKGIPHKIEFVWTWLTFVFIGIGVATLIRRYKEMSFPELGFKKPDFLKTKFEVGYLVVTLACVGLLAMVITVPFIAVGYGLDRMYPFAITILSVFFVIGGLMIAKYSNKVFAVFRRNNPFRKNIDERRASQLRAYLIIFVVLIPYFFCVTGVSYQMFGVPRAITLNSEGEDQYDVMYVHDQESYSAKWLKEYGESKRKVYTDFYGRLRLISQAGFSPNSLDWHSLSRHRKIDGYIYLRYYNVVNDKLLGRDERSHIFTSYNLTEYDDVFIKKDKIYNNGGSEVYR